MIVNAAQAFLETHGIRGPLLVAVSGGPDSTALLLALHEIGLPISAAHINHHLRGAESDADQQFVREMCARLGIALRVADGSLDPDQIRRHGIEAAARDVRHARLHEIRSETGASHIATAHQKNDQAETILMRLMTGGGLAGLRGIHPVRADGVIRPLLDVSRDQIEAFLRQRGVVPRIDRSNSDPRFLRNRVRALLTQFDASVIDNLAAVARHGREQWTILEEIVDRLDTGKATRDETRFKTLPPEPWLRRALLHRHIRRLDPSSRDVSATDLERLASELDSLKRVSVTRNLELLRRRGEWILRRKPEPVDEFEIELTAGESAYIPQIGATIRIGPQATGNRPRFQLPASSEPKFTIRNRRDGDRFHPLGMPREKKLKDFLIDRKIPSEFRDRIPLVLWRGRIVLLAGVEVSEAFKITGEGKVYEVAIEETNQEGVQRQTDRQADR
ncbi:MAG: tRNA lysidine(34) synthetase TilS [Acidobacteriota bacterium]|nr:tRNA lysidine(34) synthetase TilS [Acidobacteriota bacterium]